MDGVRANTLLHSYYKFEVAVPEIIKTTKEYKIKPHF